MGSDAEIVGHQTEQIKRKYAATPIGCPRIGPFLTRIGDWTCAHSTNFPPAFRLLYSVAASSLIAQASVRKQPSRSCYPVELVPWSAGSKQLVVAYVVGDFEFVYERV
jgi:hypothetical protein